MHQWPYETTAFYSSQGGATKHKHRALVRMWYTCMRLRMPMKSFPCPRGRAVAARMCKLALLNSSHI